MFDKPVPPPSFTRESAIHTFRKTLDRLTGKTSPAREAVRNWRDRVTGQTRWKELRNKFDNFTGKTARDDIRSIRETLFGKSKAVVRTGASEAAAFAGTGTVSGRVRGARRMLRSL